MVFIAIAIIVASLMAYCTVATFERHDDDALTEFDAYELPPREDFVLETEDDIDDLAMEALCLCGVPEQQLPALREFARGKAGWFYSEIIRAFYRAQLGIKEA